MRQDTNLSTISPAQLEWPQSADGRPASIAELLAQSLIENIRVERWLAARRPQQELDAKLDKCGQAYDRVRRTFILGAALVAGLAVAAHAATPCSDQRDFPTTYQYCLKQARIQHCHAPNRMFVSANGHTWRCETQQEYEADNPPLHAISPEDWQRDIENMNRMLRECSPQQLEQGRCQ